MIQRALIADPNLGIPVSGLVKVAGRWPHCFGIPVAMHCNKASVIVIDPPRVLQEVALKVADSVPGMGTEGWARNSNYSQGSFGIALCRIRNSSYQGT